MSFLFSHALGRVIFFAPKEVLLILRFDALKAVRTSVVRGSRECLAFVMNKDQCKLCDWLSVFQALDFVIVYLQ